MPNITFDIDNKCGVLSHNSLIVDSGTTWTITDNTIQIGDVLVTATPINGWLFTGNWGQINSSGTITEDKTFTANFKNGVAKYDVAPSGQIATYTMLLCKNTGYCADNWGDSTQNDNEIILASRNFSTAQEFVFLQGETSGYTKIRNIKNGGFIYANKTIELDTQHIKLHSGNHSPQEIDWKFEENTDNKAIINGVEYNSQEIIWAANNDYRIDDYGQKVENFNNLVLHEKNSSLAQMWIPIKIACLENTWQIPEISASEKKPAMEKDTSKYVNLGFKGSSTFQYRIRKRTLEHNTSNWSNWSDWESPTGLKSDGGWGDVWNQSATQIEDIEVIGADTTNNIDSYEYDLEVRTFGLKQRSFGNVPYASYSSNLRLSTRQTTNTNISSCTYTTNGLVFALNTDAYRRVEKADITIKDIYIGHNKLSDDISVKLSPTGTYEVVVPLEDLYYKPSEGATIKCDYSINYNDKYIVNSDGNATNTIIYDGGDLELMITADYFNVYDVGITILNTDLVYQEVKLEYEHDGEVIVREIQADEWSENDYRVPNPLNTGFDIYVYGRTETQWGAKRFKFRENPSTGEFAIQKSLGIVINGYREELALEEFENSLAFEKSIDCGLESVELHGKKYEDFFYTGTQKGDIKVKGAYVNEQERRSLEKIKNNGYCVLRDNMGGFYNCAIKSVNFDNIANLKYWKAELTLAETNREVDISWPIEEDSNELDW